MSFVVFFFHSKQQSKGTMVLNDSLPFLTHQSLERGYIIMLELISSREEIGRNLRGGVDEM